MIQGTTLTFVAKLFHVALPERIKPVSATEKFISELPKTAMREFKVGDDCYASNKRIVDLTFPKTALIAMIKRNDKYLTPNGSTIILPEDTLLVLSENEEGLEKVNEILSG